MQVGKEGAGVHSHPADPGGQHEGSLLGPEERELEQCVHQWHPVVLPLKDSLCACDKIILTGDKTERKGGQLYITAPHCSLSQ